MSEVNNLTDSDQRQTRPRLSLIAAVAENNVIGAGNEIPWRLSNDMKRFKRLTIGKPVIMGRRTADSLGKPLVDRTNIVVTRKELAMPGFVRVTSIEEAIDVASADVAALGGDEIMIAGGGEIYAATIKDADRLYITHVDVRPDGDTFFPPISDFWRISSSEDVPAGERDSHASRFTIYDRLGAA